MVASELPGIGDVLRGDRRRRPPADRRIAGGLRAELDDAIYELARRHPRTDALTIRPGDVRGVAAGDPSPYPRLRGALVHELLRLGVAGLRTTDHFADAVAAWRSEHGDAAALAHLDADELARLASEVTAHGVTLERRLGEIAPSWRPRTNVAAIQRLAGGAVIARDLIDLVVGTHNADAASIALFDLTTGALSTEHERVLRYHALIETLRSQVAPLRVATLSSLTGDVWSIDVDRGLLRRALDELIATISARWSQP
jgi:hypothetical protein